MILADANFLVYAHVGSFRQHESARTWLDAQLNGNFPVGYRNGIVRCSRIALGWFRNAGEPGAGRSSRIAGHRARIDTVLYRRRFCPLPKSALAKSAFDLIEHPMLADSRDAVQKEVARGATEDQ